MGIFSRNKTPKESPSAEPAKPADSPGIEAPPKPEAPKDLNSSPRKSSITKSTAAQLSSDIEARKSLSPKPNASSAQLDDTVSPGQSPGQSPQVTRNNFLKPVTPPEDSRKEVVVEVQIADSLFKSGFHYFIKAYVVSGGGIAGEDHTDVSMINERPKFARSILRIKGLAGSTAGSVVAATALATAKTPSEAPVITRKFAQAVPDEDTNTYNKELTALDQARSQGPRPSWVPGSISLTQTDPAPYITSTSYFRPAYTERLVVEAWAFIGDGVTKQLGSFLLPLEGFEIAGMSPEGQIIGNNISNEAKENNKDLLNQSRELVIPGAQFVRDGKVYGKSSLRVRLVKVDFGAVNAPPPILELAPDSSKSNTVSVSALASQPTTTTSDDKHQVSLEIQNLLIKEHAARCDSLRKAQDEISALQKINEKLLKENADIKDELDSWDRRAGLANNEELSLLTPEELVNKLRTSLSRYRAEKARNEDMKKRFDTAETDSARKQELERKLAELTRQNQTMLTQIEAIKAEEDKIETYKETILAQEQVINRLEKVIQKSVKEVKDAQTAQIELERLRSENAKLKHAQRHQSLANAGRIATLNGEDTEAIRFEMSRAKDRIASLEKQLIDAAKAHAKQITELQFKLQ